MKRISVVVPTYEEERSIQAFLKQFENQTIPRSEFEIIIVDGDSEDRTREIAGDYADKVIIQERKGIGGARNDGVDIAGAPFIATTDADIRLPARWLEIMLSHFEKDEKVVAVVGPDGPIEKTWKSRLVYFFLRNVIYLATFFGMYTTGGTNSGFRRSAFLEVGGYKSLPHSDDVEIGFRLMKVGKIVYVKELFVELSVRRMEKNGYVNTLLTWLKGDLRILFGLDIGGKGYAKQKY
jgi:glycosyltransferase involved in cell wall biosynthesis